MSTQIRNLFFVRQIHFRFYPVFSLISPDEGKYSKYFFTPTNFLPHFRRHFGKKFNFLVVYFAPFNVVQYSQLIAS